MGGNGSWFGGGGVVPVDASKWSYAEVQDTSELLHSDFI